MTALPDIRSRVRNDLRNLDASDAHWSVAELDRHIARALADLSRVVPREASALLSPPPRAAASWP